MNYITYQKLLLCFSVILVISSTYAEEPTKKLVSQQEIIDAVKTVEESNMKLLLEAEQKMELSKAEAAKKNFADAIKLAEQAIKHIKGLRGSYVQYKREAMKRYLNQLNVQWAASEMDRARKAYIDKKFVVASSAARNAMRIDHNLSTEAEAFIKKCEKKINFDNLVDNSKIEKISPGYNEKVEDIKVLLKTASVYMDHKFYDKAQEALEKVLLKDPYNKEAAHSLNILYEKLKLAGAKRRRANYSEAMATLEWNWTEQLPPAETVSEGDKPSVKTSEESGLHEKLQKIIFDNLEFDDASITSVISHLNSLSKQADPEHVGVSIVSNLTNTETAEVKRITMSFDHIPMGEAIRYICLGANLKYKIEENAVIIGDKNIDEMDTRFFKVRYALIASIAGDTVGATMEEEDFTDSETDIDLEDTFSKDGEKKKSGGGGGGGGAGVGGELGGGGASSSSNNAMVKYFSDRGIQFDEGATIAYDRRAGTLIVKNTYENLRKLEHLLRDLDIQTPLVLIEAKIVEMTQTDLEELGFDWVFSSAGSSDTHPHWSFGENSTLLRHYSADNSNTTDSSSQNYKFLNDLSILPNFGGEGSNLNLSLTINAIDQHSKDEILSAPKVIATSGTTALIRMVEETYYPESWDDPELSVSEGTIELTPPDPEFGDPTDIGIRFQVTPTVSPNNYTISLHLIPQVVSFSDWMEYPLMMYAGTTTIDNITIKMPIISRRDLDTNVKVFDGETIVLGGMLQDTTVERNDKWPFLGDVPLLGRLFSSQLYQSEKINLLIFVTARLINNDGVPVREGSLRGVPDFNR